MEILQAYNHREREKGRDGAQEQEQRKAIMEEKNKRNLEKRRERNDGRKNEGGGNTYIKRQW